MNFISPNHVYFLKGTINMDLAVTRQFLSAFFMTPKIPGIDAKIVRDDVVIALIDVVQRFPQKM